MNSSTTKSIFAMCFACTIWGLSGIYYDQLSHIPPAEVLAHRSLWAMIFFSLVLLSQRRVPILIKNLLVGPNFLLLGMSALMIAVNWFAFIFAVQTSQAIQASFGYYIFPLVAILLGYFFKGERFSKMQTIAIFLATVSVILLGFEIEGRLFFKFFLIQPLLTSTFSLLVVTKGVITSKPGFPFSLRLYRNI